MYKRLNLLFFTVILLTIIMLTGCEEPKSPSDPKIGITIDPVSASAGKGGTADFTAKVTASDKKLGNVAWKVDGKNDSRTAIVSTGPFTAKLTVGSDETAKTLTVTVTSDRGKKPSASAIVTVTELVEQPEIVSVTISPKTQTVARGAQQQFTAEVAVTGGASKTVEWAVSGQTGPATNISSSGLLTVDENEGNGPLTVTVMSTVNPEKKDTAAVTIVNTGDGVNSVTISPKNPSVARGGSQAFTVTVDAKAVANTVEWELRGANHPDTKINNISTNTHSAVLNVSADETSGSLTVTVTSTVDSTKIDTAAVTLTGAVTVNNIWLVGTMTGWETGFPPGQIMNVSGNTFTWEGDVTENSTFRFSLIDTTGWNDIWNGSWYAPPANNTVVTGNNEYTMIRYDTNQSEGAASATENAWKIETAGKYKLIVDPATMKLRIEKPGAAILPSPSKPGFSNQGVASWTALSPETDVVSYTVELLKGGNTVTNEGAKATVAKGGAYSKDFISVMRSEGAGAYTVTVTANGNGGDIISSNPSAASDPQTVIKRPTVTQLVWDGDTAKWSSGTGDTTGLGYIVKLFKDGNEAAQQTVNVLQYNFASAVTANGSYTFKVTAQGNSTLVLASDESGASPVNSKLVDIWLVGDMTSWKDDITPLGVAMQKAGNTFTWNGPVTAGSMFRFSLTNTTGWTHKWNGIWFAPPDDGYIDGGVSVSLNEVLNNMYQFNTNQSEGAESATENVWKINESGNYTFTVDPAAMKLRVEKEGTTTLPAPAKPGFSAAGAATWTALADEGKVVSYTVQLFKDSNAVIGTGGNVTINKGGAYSSDFISVMRTEGAGTYSVKVTANGNNIDTVNSSPSEASDSQTVIKRSVTNPVWDGDTAKWSSGGDTTGLDYIVKLFKDGNEAVQQTAAALQYNFASNITTLGNGIYTFKVTAQGNNTLVLGSEESAASAPNEKLFKVWLIGTMTGWSINSSQEMTISGSTFTWEGNVAADSTFRFNLTDIAAAGWDRAWYTPSDADLGEQTVTIGAGGNTITRVKKETSNNWKITQAGYYKFILNPAESKLYVERPVIVDDVKINSSDTSFIPDRKPYTFTAEIEGKNTENLTGTWAVASVGGVKHNDTNITASGGVLTIAAGELSSQLKITVTVNGVSYDRIINLVDSSAVGQVKIIGLTVTDLGANYTAVIEGAPLVMPVIYKAGGAPGEDRVTFTVTPQEGHSYEWIVSGKRHEGTSIIIEAANYGLGRHNITLAVTTNGRTWSTGQSLYITVAASK